MNALRRSLAIAAALLLAAHVSAAGITGSGKSATETRAVSGFRAIAIAVPGKVDIAGSGSVRRLGAAPG